MPRDWILGRAGDGIRILRHLDARPEERSRALPLSAVAWRLRDWALDPLSRGALTDVLTDVDLGAPWPLADRGLDPMAARLEQAFERGELVALPLVVELTAVLHPPGIEPPTIEAVRETTWIHVSLWDSDGKPLAGQRCMLTAEGRGQASSVLDEDGAASLEGIPAGRTKALFPDIHRRPPGPTPQEIEAIRVPSARAITRRDRDRTYSLANGAAYDFQLERRDAHVLEIDPFHEGGVVLLPGQAPRASNGDEAWPTGVGMLAACLRYAEQHPEHRLLITGHASPAAAPSTPAPPPEEPKGGRPPGHAYLIIRRTDSIWPVKLAQIAVGDATRYVELDPINPHLVSANGWRPLYPGHEINVPAAWVPALRRAGYDVRDAPPPEPPPSPEGKPGLSRRRAEGVVHLLLGERDAWAELCAREGTEEELRSILAWSARTRVWSCDPLAFSGDRALPLALYAFQRSYGLEFGGSVDIDGASGRETWGAIFDVFMAALRRALDVDAGGLDRLRSKLSFVTAVERAIGCGQRHPITPHEGAAHRRGPRRAEALFFGPGDAPRLVCHEGSSPCTSASCELYDPREYALHYLRAGRASALDWRFELFVYVPSWARAEPSIVVRKESGEVVARLSSAASGSDGTVSFDLSELDPSLVYWVGSASADPGLAPPWPIAPAAARALLTQEIHGREVGASLLHPERA